MVSLIQSMFQLKQEKSCWLIINMNERKKMYDTATLNFEHWIHVNIGWGNGLADGTLELNFSEL